jgi:hypothetical protein
LPHRGGKGRWAEAERIRRRRVQQKGASPGRRTGKIALGLGGASTRGRGSEAPAPTLTNPGRACRGPPRSGRKSGGFPCRCQDAKCQDVEVTRGARLHDLQLGRVPKWVGRDKESTRITGGKRRTPDTGKRWASRIGCVVFCEEFDFLRILHCCLLAPASAVTLVVFSSTYAYYFLVLSVESLVLESDQHFESCQTGIQRQFIPPPPPVLHSTPAGCLYAARPLQTGTCPKRKHLRTAVELDTLLGPRFLAVWSTVQSEAAHSPSGLH